MNAIAAIYSFAVDGAEPVALTRLNDVARVTEPSASIVLPTSRGGLCCRHAAGDAAPASGFVRRANVHVSGVASARIDNRVELVRSLADIGAAATDSDVELLLKAYATWGCDGFRRVVGDFVVAIWDAASDRLICACDPLGVKPLYVRMSRNGVAIASQLSPLLVRGGPTPAPDLEYIADQLASGTLRANSASTPYVGITRLLPGHALVAEPGGARTVRYWDWDISPRITYTRPDDYALHFLSLFTDAVRARLRTAAGSVWADLSGGLDSSSIVCVASELATAGAVSGPVSTVSVVFPKSSDSDERHWANHVRRKYRLAAHLIDGDCHHPLRSICEEVEWWDEPHPSIVFAAVQRQYRDLLATHEGSVLLSGAAAETVVLGGSEGPIHFADLLARGRWMSLGRELRAWQRVRRVPFSNLLVQYGLRPWLGRRRVSYEWPRSVHAWIAREFARRYALGERARLGTMPRRFVSPADQLHYEKVGRARGFLLRGSLEKHCEVRYPFLDRRLIEFMLRVPWDAKLRAGEGKTLLRHGMRGILPEEIRTRRAVSSFGQAVYLGIKKEWGTVDALIRSSRLAELGCIDRPALLNAARLARAGHAPDLHGLITTLSLEAWLQGAFGRTPRVSLAGDRTPPRVLGAGAPTLQH